MLVLMMMEELIYNLTDNAIRYNNRDGSVDVTVSAQDGHTVLEVKDTGIGIPGEEQEAVFERFIRSSQVISGKQDGLGLGLAIVREYVSAMGGKITLSSEVGNGSSFTVWMPYGKDENR